MAQKIEVWLSDRDAERFHEHARSRSLTKDQLGAVLLCHSIGWVIPMLNREVLKGWVSNYEQMVGQDFWKAEQEAAQPGRFNGLKAVMQVMAEAERQLSGPEIFELSGYKKRGGVHRILTESAYFTEVDPPEGWKHRTSGRRPKFWVMNRIGWQAWDEMSQQVQAPSCGADKPLLR